MECPRPPKRFLPNYRGLDLVADSVPTIASIPIEILVAIFQYLDVKDLVNVCLVCRYWKEVAYEKIPWSDVEVKLRLTGRSQTLYDSLKFRKIQNFNIISSSGYNTLKKFFESLGDSIAELNLAHIPLTDTVLTKALQLPFFSHLSIIDISGKEVKLSGGCFDKMCSKMPSVRMLTMKTCQFQDLNSCIATISRSMKNLECLDISYARHPNLNAAGLKPLGNLPLRSLIAAYSLDTPVYIPLFTGVFGELQEVNLSGNVFLCNNMNSIPPLRELRYLVLQDVRVEFEKHQAMTKSNALVCLIKCLAGNSEQLKRLDVGRNCINSADVIEQLAVVFPRITHLLMSYNHLSCTFAQHVCQKLEKLEYLDIRCSSNTTAQLIEEICSKANRLSRLICTQISGVKHRSHLLSIKEKYPIITIIDSAFEITFS